MKTIKKTIDRMKCEGCAETVHDAVVEVAGVIECKTVLQEKAVYIKLEDNVDTKQIDAKIKEAGFEATSEEAVADFAFDK